MKLILKLCLSAALLAVVSADIYLHNPRGSNNRYKSNANDPEVNNADRLFDSQNNNDGGYDHSELTSVSERMGYYAGSELVIQWASQHACGAHSNANCEMVLQYMCSRSDYTYTDENRFPRDGASNNDNDFTETVPADSDGASVGMHEPWYNYHGCTRRDRNRGLFIADRDLNTNDARSTRQENNGNNRDGLECHEERDYYPYWAPSEWKDIAILTNEVDRCEYYWNNTQNTNPKYQCVDPDENYNIYGKTFKGVEKYLTKTECEQNKNGNQVSYVWQTVPPHFHQRTEMQDGTVTPSTIANPNVPFWGASDPAKREECLWFDDLVARGEMDSATRDRKCKAALGGPLCRENRWQRDNHLGFVSGGYFANFTWLIPDDVSDHCVFRIRYNISTSDYDSWDTFSESNGDEETGAGSIIYQDQLVEQWLWDYPIELALNTNQYGRTFQDRSHTFRILARNLNTYPESQTIHNVNVRGKRGHITQTYPSPTLSFVPKELHVSKNDWVHFQWEGGNTYPDDYFGGGADRKDRSNLAQIAHMKSDIPLAIPLADANARLADLATMKKLLMAGQRDAHIAASNGTCKSQAQLRDDHNLDNQAVGTEGYYNALKNIREDAANCAWLNLAPAYFGIDPIQMTQLEGTSFYYMSTRNNIVNIQKHKGAIHISS